MTIQDLPDGRGLDAPNEGRPRANRALRHPQTPSLRPRGSSIAPITPMAVIAGGLSGRLQITVEHFKVISTVAPGGTEGHDQALLLNAAKCAQADAEIFDRLPCGEKWLSAGLHTLTPSQCGARWELLLEDRHCVLKAFEQA